MFVNACHCVGAVLTFSLCLCLCRELKDPVYLRDKVSQKHSKEQFDAALKIEQDYSKFFTGVDVNSVLLL